MCSPNSKPLYIVLYFFLKKNIYAPPKCEFHRTILFLQNNHRKEKFRSVAFREFPNHSDKEKHRSEKGLRHCGVQVDPSKLSRTVGHAAQTPILAHHHRCFTDYRLPGLRSSLIVWVNAIPVSVTNYPEN